MAHYVDEKTHRTVKWASGVKTTRETRTEINWWAHSAIGGMRRERFARSSGMQARASAAQASDQKATSPGESDGRKMKRRPTEIRDATENRRGAARPFIQAINYDHCHSNTRKRNRAKRIK